MSVLIKLFILLTLIFSTCDVTAQSDFIILKKKNKTIKTFYPGSNIQFMTKGGAYRDAVINSIRNDSIFLQEFLVRQIPTTIGTFILDTAGSFRYAYNYNDIHSFGSSEQKKFNVAGSGAALLGGGILLTLASGVVYVADRDKFSPGLLTASAGLGVLGYFMSKAGSKGIVVGKKNYRLQYMGVSNHQ